VTRPGTLVRGTSSAYRGTVRAHGGIDELPGAGPTDHVCWIYDGDADFDAAVQEFFTSGLARGERVLCVGERVVEGLRTATGGVPDLEELIARGAVETLTLAQVYEATSPFRPEQQLTYYDDATRRAVDDGFRGLRVIAEVSGLATDPARRPELVRWEQIADDFAAQDSGFSAMCAYRADLGPEALADVASVHPLVHALREVSTFALFAETDRLVLAGSVDTFSSDRLARLLGSAPIAGDVVVLDLAALEFVDVASCRVLARWVAALAERSLTVQVTGSSRLLRRMWQVLGLDQVAPVAFVDVAG
jgi:anti-anti-sigma regulatory factor